MKKSLLIILVIFALVFLGWSLRSLLSFISTPLRIENFDKIKKNEELLYLKLLFSKDDVIHFEKLYSKYKFINEGPEYQSFLKDYNLLNKWRKSKIEYKGEIYNIKVKSMGKTPTDHKERNFISLNIKVLKGKIEGVSRFNLIVYWRIKRRHDVVGKLSSYLNLQCQKGKLSIVEISEMGKKLFWFEPRLKPVYLRKEIGKNIISLDCYGDNSLIYTNDENKNIDLLNSQVENELDKLNLNNELQSQISKDYEKFNKAILNQNTNVVNNYLDIEYIFRLQVFRYIYGDDYHGFNTGNLLVSYNTIKRKFYPMTHRDCISKKLKPKIDLFSQMHNNVDRDMYSKLLEVSFLDDRIRKNFNQYLKKFIANNSYEIKNIVKSSKHYDDFYYSTSIKSKIGLQEPVFFINNNLHLLLNDFNLN